MDTFVEMENDATFMREALRLAAKAREADEVPVGAVVVRAGKIIGRAYNQIELLKDATAPSRSGRRRLASGGLRSLRDQRAMRDVRRRAYSRARSPACFRMCRYAERSGWERHEFVAESRLQSSL